MMVAKPAAVAACNAYSGLSYEEKPTLFLEFHGTLAYARVDILRDGDGVFRLMELELIEPSLFLRFAPDNGTAFAEALLATAFMPDGNRR